jgi:DNA adenine methylase
VAVVVEQRFPSPLRYPGGKGKLANFVKLLLLRNGFVGREYVEPYAGGASVALSLLYEEYASHIHINDLNTSIFTFWRVALDQPDLLCERIRDVSVTVDEWQRQRAVQEDLDATDVDRAFSTLFLNRTTRSGILTGGVIGGLDQQGPWKIDARFSREDLVRRIQKIARHRSRITLTNLDAAHYLRDRLPELDEAFVYLDPPYFVKGGELYQNSYSPTDHATIAELVCRLSIPWIVSYDAVPDIDALYSPTPRLAYDLSYSAQARYRGSEVMFFHPEIEVPQDLAPAKVHWRDVDAERLRNAT